MAIIHAIDARLKIRVFSVTYWPNLDALPGAEIKLGVFGDLRLGKRYALGLIARTKVAPDEIQRVGRIGRHIVDAPYTALREMWEEIWGTPSPGDTFDRVLSRSHTSLLFSQVDEVIEATSAIDKENLETTRTWCTDRLRPVIRERFLTWMKDPVSSPVLEGEHLDQLEAA